MFKKTITYILCVIISLPHYLIAQNFPAEPMTIYWNINGINTSNSKLVIEDGNWNIIKKFNLNWNKKYWTKKTFSDNKINLNKFEWKLTFYIIKNWKKFNIQKIEKGEIEKCNKQTVFQKGCLCEYNLKFENTWNEEDFISISKPEKIKVFSIDHNSLKLKWSKVNNANMYQIYNVNNDKEYNISNNTKYITWLESSTLYTFRIKSINNNKFSNYNEKKIKTFPTPVIFDKGNPKNIESNSINNIDKNDDILIKDNKENIEKLLKGKIWTDKLNTLKKLKKNNDIIVSKKWIQINGSKKMKKPILLFENWKNKLDQKNMVWFPQNIQISEKNYTIQPPKEIEEKNTVKEKIKKDVDKVIEVKTNKKLTFSWNFIDICMWTNLDNTNNIEIYYSNDNNKWQKDKNAKDINIKNWSLCFKTNHLTSFATTINEESNKPSSKNQTSGWWGGGQTIYSDCKKEDLICKKTSSWIYKFYRKKWVYCEWGKLGKNCNKEERKKENNTNKTKLSDLSHSNIKNKFNENLISKDIAWNKIYMFFSEKEKIYSLCKNLEKYFFGQIKNKKLKNKIYQYFNKISLLYGVYKKENLIWINKGKILSSIKENIYKIINIYNEYNKSLKKDSNLSWKKNKEKKEINNTNTLKIKSFYKINTKVINLSIDKDFSAMIWKLYYWDKVRLLEKKWNIYTVKVVNAKNWYWWYVWHLKWNVLGQIEKEKEGKKEINNNKNIKQIWTYSVKMFRDSKFDHTNAYLYKWEKVKILKKLKNISKVKILTSKDWYQNKIWYISNTFLK